MSQQVTAKEIKKWHFRNPLGVSRYWECLGMVNMRPPLKHSMVQTAGFVILIRSVDLVIRYKNNFNRTNAFICRNPVVKHLHKLQIVKHLK